MCKACLRGRKQTLKLGGLVEPSLPKVLGHIQYTMI